MRAGGDLERPAPAYAGGSLRDSPMIRIDNLTVRTGAFELRDVSFSVDTGRYAVLMGKTGCGKTTLLEAICGLKTVQAGRVLLDERDVTRLRPADRGIGYVPQDGALFPTLTVREHLAFALGIRSFPAQETEKRVEELAALLGLRHLLHRFPQGLSGGEAQRVALGRALAWPPNVLLLDEPLSALDEETREEMAGLLRTVREKTRVTVLHVTHNRSEAKRLADVLLVFRDRQIVESPLPDQEAVGSGNVSGGQA